MKVCRSCRPIQFRATATAARTKKEMGNDRPSPLSVRTEIQTDAEMVFVKTSLTNTEPDSPGRTKTGEAISSGTETDPER